MDDYIRREAAKAQIRKAYTRIEDRVAINCVINDVPAADVAPVRHGQWIKNDNGTWSCERCHSWIPDEQHYYARFCLYCGAKMDGGAEDGGVYQA